MKRLQPLAIGALVLVSTMAVRADDSPKTPKGEIGGRLKYASRSGDIEGIDAGQPCTARKYIAGDPRSSQRAVWEFTSLPKSLTDAPGDVVRAELTGALFYLGKEAGIDALVVIRVVSHNCPQGPPEAKEQGDWNWIGKNAKDQKEKYEVEVAAFRAKKIDPDKPDAEGWKAANTLAEKHGYFEVSLPKFPDLTKTSIDLPAGLFRNALKNAPQLGDDGNTERPLVSIYLKCETKQMLLGVKEADLHLVEKTPPKK